MNLENRVNTSGSSINQKSVAQKNGHNVGSLSKYNETTPLKQISVNQIIKGEITDLRNNEVTVILADNTTITGRLTNGSKLSIGDTAAFKIADVNPKIVMEALPQKESILENATIQKALDAAGLPKNAKNQLVVRELMNNNMPINKQGIVKILQQSYQYKESSIRNLVLLNKHSIPVTPENVTQFENYQTMNHQLVKGIDFFAESIPSLLNTLSEHSSSKAVVPFGSQLLDILLPTEDKNVLPSSPALSLPTKDFEYLSLILENFSPSDSHKEAMLTNTAPLRDVIHLINQSMDTAYSIDIENMEALKSTLLSDAKAANIEPDMSVIDTELARLPKSMDVFHEPFIADLFHSFGDLQHQNNELGAFLNPEQRTDLSDALKEFPLSKEIMEQLLNGELPAKDMSMAIKDMLPLVDNKAVLSLFQSDVFQTVLKHAIASNWTLSPEDLKKEGSVDALYEAIFKQTKQLENFFQNTLGSNETGAALSGQAKNMNQNMDFMQTLNQMFSYVQLPLKLKDQHVHSELYVYTKKRELNKNPDNISILLHLDMEKLGPLDIYLSLNQNQIVSKFYLNDTSSKNLFKDHIEELSDSLQKSGYSITSEFLLREKEVDIVKDFIEMDRPDNSMTRYTFDIRA